MVHILDVTNSKISYIVSGNLMRKIYVFVKMINELDDF